MDSARPASCRLAREALGLRRGFDRAFSHLALSPGGRRICLRTVPDSEGSADHQVGLDIWERGPLRLVGTLWLEELSGSTWERAEGRLVRNIRCVSFLDDDHLALGLSTGSLEVIRLEAHSGGELVIGDHWGAVIGGSIAAMDRSQRHLAVSLHPGQTEEPLYSALGVKLYRIEDLLRRRIEPARHLGWTLFKILPVGLRFDPRGQQLWGWSYQHLASGFRAVVYKVQTDGSHSELILEQERPARDVVLSSPRDEEWIVVASSSAWRLTDGTQELSCADIPSGTPSRCELSPDGSKAYVLMSDGTMSAWPLDREGAAATPFLRDLGKIRGFGLTPEGAIICLVSLNDSYELIEVRPGAQAAIEGAAKGRIEPLKPRAFDVDLGGNLYIGDEEGRLRRLSPDLHLRPPLYTGLGAIQDVLRHPSEPKVACLSCSGAVDWVGPTSWQAVRACYPDGRPLNPGSGRLRLQFTPLGELYTGGFLRTSYSWIEEGRCWWVWWSRELPTGWEGRVAVWLRQEGGPVEPEVGVPMVLVQNFAVPWIPVAATELYNSPVCLTKEGQLLAIHPSRCDYAHFATPRSEYDTMLRGEGDHRTVLLDGLGGPRGLTRLGPDLLALWTESDLRLLRVSPDWSVTEEHRAVATGVTNLKHDPVGERLILCHDHHLSICSLDLTERLRLWLLRDGSVLLQAPVPAGLRRGADQDHPGYFWHQCASSTPDDDQLFDLLEVLDADGRPLPDRSARRTYLGRFFRPELVRLAIDDPVEHLRILASARRRTEPLASRLKALPPAP
jgi:hypothetical protein